MCNCFNSIRRLIIIIIILSTLIHYLILIEDNKMKRNGWCIGERKRERGDSELKKFYNTVQYSTVVWERFKILLCNEERKNWNRKQMIEVSIKISVEMKQRHEDVKIHTAFFVYFSDLSINFIFIQRTFFSVFHIFAIINLTK